MNSEELSPVLTVDSSVATDLNCSAKDAATEQPPLSKNMRKRLLKQERWKTIKQQKKEIKGSTRDDPKSDAISEVSVHDQAERAEFENKKTIASARRIMKRQNFAELCRGSFDVIIDCSWEEEHSDRALKSLAQQIMFCYGLNKNSPNPCNMHITHAGPRLLDQLAKSNYTDWMSFRATSSEFTNISLPKELVYLTSDAEESLVSLDPSCAYVIGGIVDRNRLKKITFTKALQLGIRTAKLPLKEYCKMSATPVLTINHVFSILLKYAATQSWPYAFSSILPRRKGVSLLNKSDDDCIVSFSTGSEQSGISESDNEEDQLVANVEVGRSESFNEVVEHI
jgi:tRNA (guanine9-N1)-methyltransferase